LRQKGRVQNEEREVRNEGEKGSTFKMGGCVWQSAFSKSGHGTSYAVHGSAFNKSGRVAGDGSVRAERRKKIKKTQSAFNKNELVKFMNYVGSVTFVFLNFFLRY
jgi:hypothetical protein